MKIETATMVGRHLSAIARIALLGVALWSCTGGHGGTGPSSTGGGATGAVFTPDAGSRFQGSHPAPVAVNGVMYVYQNTGTDGTSVEASSDGLTFAGTAAKYPAGISRTIVSLPDGRYRMYYFSDANTVDVSSAVSSDALNWTVEDGARYSNPDIGAIRAIALPTGGYRLYFPTSAGLGSASSSDGLMFRDDGPMAIALPSGATRWGPSAAIYVNGQFHMVLTVVPASGISEFWHATSTDGRTWNVDRSVLAANPGVPINQPAWGVNGGVFRVYYRAQPPGGGNAIASGTMRF